MNKDYQEILNRAVESRAEREKVFKKIKKKRPKNLDAVFHEAHDEAFSKIDCLECANCCKTTSPIFRDVDVKRISQKLKMKTADFEKNYLKKDEDGDWVLQSSPCFFLGDDNKCFIYDFRPQACAEYPHTNRKRMIQILDLTKNNAELCPATAIISSQVTFKFD